MFDMFYCLIYKNGFRLHLRASTNSKCSQGCPPPPPNERWNPSHILPRARVPLVILIFVFLDLNDYINTGADAGWLPWLPGQPPFCFEIFYSV